MTTARLVADLRGSALCPVEIEVDVPLLAAIVAVDLGVSVPVVAVDLCAPDTTLADTAD